MFSIEEKTEAGIGLIMLSDTTTVVKILPRYGALLHEFSVAHHGKQVNVVEPYGSSEALSTGFENGGFKSAKLSPFVCRLKDGRYHFGEKDYEVSKFFLGEHAIHGLLYDQPFTIMEKAATADEATVLLKHQYRGSDPGYPFHYDCDIRYRLGKENLLSIETTLINRDAGIIPVADGWHPYFSFGGSINDLQLEFQSKEMLEFDHDLLPTGKLIPYQEFGSLKQIGDAAMDNCFTVNFAECQPLVVLRDKAMGLQLAIRPAKSYPYLQVYTPPHRNSIALENLSSAPDAFNNGMGLISLAPGSSTSFSTQYQLSAL
ncbi:MAG: Aldose 1-epimerase [Ferruginibacter sp.]|nr:Aldose 1-epimerase [Ferruginibacter sp.]